MSDSNNSGIKHCLSHLTSLIFKHPESGGNDQNAYLLQYKLRDFLAKALNNGWKLSSWPQQLMISQFTSQWKCKWRSYSTLLSKILRSGWSGNKIKTIHSKGGDFFIKWQDLNQGNYHGTFKAKWPDQRPLDHGQSFVTRGAFLQD